jgi:plastocyanin
MTVRSAVGVAFLILMAGCSKNSSPSAPSGPAPGAVSIPMGATTLGSHAYTPNPITVSLGTAVTWTNNDTTAHTATSDAPGFDSGSISPGRTFSFTFQSRGNFPYHCSFHQGMIGTVVVQ